MTGCTVAGSHTLYVLLIATVAVVTYRISRWWANEVLAPWLAQRGKGA